MTNKKELSACQKCWNEKMKKVKQEQKPKQATEKGKTHKCESCGSQDGRIGNVYGEQGELIETRCLCVECNADEQERLF